MVVYESGAVVVDMQLLFLFYPILHPTLTSWLRNPAPCTICFCSSRGSVLNWLSLSDCSSWPHLSLIPFLLFLPHSFYPTAPVLSIIIYIYSIYSIYSISSIYSIIFIISIIISIYSICSICFICMH